MPTDEELETDFSLTYELIVYTPGEQAIRIGQDHPELFLNIIKGICAESIFHSERFREAKN